MVALDDNDWSGFSHAYENIIGGIALPVIGCGVKDIASDDDHVRLFTFCRIGDCRKRP
jgi:hypothetical protein